MSGPWDYQNNSPNLARLPQHLKEQLTRNIPLRPLETYGRVVIFNRAPGLVHPNGRVIASGYRDPQDTTGPVTGAQLDTMDFSGRIPLASVIMPRDCTRNTIVGLLRAYVDMGGGSDEEVASMLAEARRPAEVFGAIKLFEEDSSNE